MKEWNSEPYHKHYQRIFKDALQEGFTEDELSSPYLDKLSKQTKSGRILRMISLAYTLGKLKGVLELDEGLTPVVLRTDIKPLKKPLKSAEWFEVRVWNNNSLRRRYQWTYERALFSEYTDKELETPCLSILIKQTKSPRVLRMINLAYYLGKLKGVKGADDGLTPVTLDDDFKCLK